MEKEDQLRLGLGRGIQGDQFERVEKEDTKDEWDVVLNCSGFMNRSGKLCRNR